MKRSLGISWCTVTVCCLAFAAPAMAQLADPANSKALNERDSAQAAPPATAPVPSVATPNVSSQEQMQAQIFELQSLIGDLNLRLGTAETMSTVQASPWSGDTAMAVPSTTITGCNDPHCPHHCGETASGSVCNYYHRFDWSKDAYVSVGAGLRTSFLSAQNQAANGTSYSRDQVIDNMRLYFNGRGHKYIGFEINTDVQNTYIRPFVTNNLLNFKLLDAIAKFGDGGALNCWVGRMLPPSDRANLSGPFYTNLYDFPFVSNEPAIFDGRQDGTTLWGLLNNQALKYSVGLYDGTNSAVAGMNPIANPNVNSSDSPQFNARLAYNFLDPETGYYNQSTYYGQKDIFAIGAAVVHQNNGVYSATDGASDYNSWTGDILYDSKLANDGVLTLSGAYYYYDTGVETNDVNANSVDGRAGLLEVGYMMASELRFCDVVGRLRPLLRWQEYHRTFGVASAANPAAITRGADLEMQYVIAGSNARLSAGWGQRDLADGRKNINVFLLGTQLQF